MRDALERCQLRRSIGLVGEIDGDEAGPRREIRRPARQRDDVPIRTTADILYGVIENRDVAGVMVLTLANNQTGGNGCWINQKNDMPGN